MFPTVLFIFWIFLFSGTSGQFDANFTLQNIWGRLPSQPGLRSMIQCVSSDSNTQGIKFSRKINTGQGTKLPRRSQQFLSGKPVFARIFLMPADDKLNRFGAFQCKQNRGGISTEIVTLKLPPEGLVELDAVSPYIVANRGDDVELEIIVQNEQNLTLKWRQDGKDEIDEWDNETKIQLSDVQERDGGIYECYYEGRRSESLHAILRLIVRSCPADFYGDNCENECPPCYNGGICHDKWGVCVCPAGFTGENCEQACGGNHFGADCSKQCTPPQEDNSKMDEGCAFHLFCKPDPYGCSCAPGFRGPKCMDHCLQGWYGADCKQPCHCAFGVSHCNRITGACEGGCARGWRGTSCQIDDPNATPGSAAETTTMAHCPIGHYGPSCEKDCHCAGNEFCDIITGQCPSGCEEGWGGGASCSACSSGRFGDNCESTCHCEGGDDNCDKEGYCLAGCQAGWAGFTCQQECTAGRFGVNCASVCHCKDGPSACDRVTGVCTGDCLPGFMGKDCQTMCPHNTFGINCVHACTCSNGGQCSRIDGACSCEGRWRGTICNESEPQIIAATDEEVNVGQQTFISCTVDAIPQPIMNITSDKFPALPFHFRKLEQNQYQAVAKVRSSDAGDIDFSCTARNKHGFDQKTVTLSVIGPPRLLKQPELQSSGNTSLVVKWDQWEYGKDEGGKHDDDSVEYMVVYRKIGSTEWLKPESWKTDRFSTLQSLEPDTEYQVAIRCRRQGKGGEGTPGPYLNVKTDCGEPLPDAIPQQFIPEVITSSSVKLTWTHPADSHLKCTLTEYKLEYYLEITPSDIKTVDIPDTMEEIELSDLTAHSGYVFHLFPVTFFGKSKYFAELIIRTTESLPGPVRNVTCTPTDDAEDLMVTWKEPLVTAGVVKGYNVTYQITNRGMCWTDPTDDHSGSTEKLTAFSTDTQLTLMNLHPYSTYLVSVQAMTSAGKGNATSATGTTAEYIPDIGPPNLRLKSKTTTSLEFEWDPIPCEQTNGKIVDYEYELVTSRLNELSHHILQKRNAGGDLDDTPKKVKGLEVNVEGLKPYKEYGIAVRGNTDAGAGPFSEFLFEMTKEEVPPAPNLLDAVPTNTSLTLKWSVPNPPLGEIIFYRLKYYVSNDPRTESYLSLNTTALNTNDSVVTGKILNLQPATEYMIKVQASTNAGWGKWSDQMRAKTLDGVPGPPTNIMVQSSTRASLEISWEEPVPTNGVITGYEISYVPVSSLDPSYNLSAVEVLTVTLEGSLKRVVLENLHASTQYLVQVSARTSVGYGPRAKENCWTVIVGEHVLPSIRPLLTEGTNETIPITFSTVGKSSIQKYQIIVEDSRNTHGINEDMLSDYKTAVNEGGLPYYITAELDPSNFSDSGEERFVVGDRNVYGGYENVHLNPGHHYSIRIRTLFKKDQGTKSLLSEPQEYVSGHSVPPVQTYDDENKIFGMDLTLFIIIVASVSVLFITVIFVTAVCVARKMERKKKVSRSERDSGISESMTWSVMYKVSESEAVDGPLVSEGYKVMHGQDNCAMSLKKVKKDSKTSIGIKVENLPEYVHNATSGTRLTDEFSRLAAGQTAPWTVARRSENLKKNRYGNILPYDRHRVVLHFDQNGSASDYINASYVDGYRRPKEYIVTQGPLECTVNDFWRMIWQESVPVIIMVTELVENEKQKCVQYWPDDSMVCGKLQILHIHSEQNTNFVIRTILMRSVEEGRTHRVHQYQYTEWPDKTIPTNPCFLIKMMKRIRNDHPVLGGPIVVHCSAGAGRSGTFVALDSLTQQAEEEKRVDIFRYVNCARLQRINLVQTPEQYVFIHESLLEAIRYEDTSIPLEMIPLYLKELNNSHSQDYNSTIQRQYETLKKTQRSVDINLCSDALSEYNIFKNRDPLTVPADSDRIRLESASDEDNYINAVKVNGYRQKDAFLVTQMPLQNTVEDFWRLVYEHKSSMILMLNGCDPDDCLNIGQYWPSKGQASYGNFEVQVVTFEDQGEVIIRIMRLISYEQPHSEPHKVIQLQYKVWKDDLPPGPPSLLNLLNTVELWYSRSSGGPITIHCMDGATRSGLFCAVSYICGQVRAEESLDVYQMAKDIRINRAEFLPNLEQYKFCFEVAQELAQFILERNNTNSMTRKKLSCYV